MSETSSFADDIEQLLAYERGRPQESDELVGRLRDRLAVTVGPFDAPQAGTPAPRSAAASSAVSSPASLGAAKLGLALLGAFAVGALSGAKWQSGRAPAPSSSLLVAATAMGATSSTAAASDVSGNTVDAGLAIDITSLPLVKPSASPALAEASSAAGKDGKDPLTAERTLIDVARTASSRGKLTEAMSALDEHASRFPRGVLSEEREGLRIQLLLAQGRISEARDRAVRFRKAFPTSLMLPAIDAQLGASSPSPAPTP